MTTAEQAGMDTRKQQDAPPPDNYQAAHWYERYQSWRYTAAAGIIGGIVYGNLLAHCHTWGEIAGVSIVPGGIPLMLLYQSLWGRK